MFNMKTVELKLISANDMYLLSEKVLGLGVSHISKRYSKAINKYLKSYNLKQESKHIYLEANNLSGYVMYKILKFDLNKYTSNSSKDCVLEVGLVNYIMIIL